MLPFWFSAMTMKSVGKAALAMVEEVRRQFNTINGLMEGTARPDYSRCVKISTDSSPREMIPPGEAGGVHYKWCRTSRNVRCFCSPLSCTPPYHYHHQAHTYNTHGSDGGAAGERARSMPSVAMLPCTRLPATPTIAHRACV